MMRKKLPIGIQTFHEIIEEGFAYVDKTKIALRLIENGKYYFLSRPRRFGKSLFIDTLKEIFEGRKSLFEGLYIHELWDWSRKYPVLKISMTSSSIGGVEALHHALFSALERAARGLKINCKKTAYPQDCFSELIFSAYEKYGKVVILIDEYDKPILDKITKPELAQKMRDALRDFYAVIKDHDAYLRFVFITGVSKFSKVTLFSGLNNLEDISMHPDYGAICGYTHRDLQLTFGEHLKGVDLEAVKAWYNGYNFLGELVYNPFDILLFISNHFAFKNYWWSTGNPSFLVDLLATGKYFIPEVEYFQATDELLDSFDVDSIRLEVLLWQTGYLTIKEFSKDDFGTFYTLGPPNKEIQKSLNSLFITFLTKQDKSLIAGQRKLYEVFLQGKPDVLKPIFTSLFASIPYRNFAKNPIHEYEGYYASVIFAYLASLGLELIPEDITNKGSIDLTIKLRGKIYIFEFKVVEAKASGNALRQIKEKNYAQKYLGQGRIFLIGMEFSKEEKNLVAFEWEEK